MYSFLIMFSASSVLITFSGAGPERSFAFLISQQASWAFHLLLCPDHFSFHFVHTWSGFNVVMPESQTDGDIRLFSWILLDWRLHILLEAILSCSTLIMVPLSRRS
ncbi:hypothetical protein BO85DRAFT_292883 [Aspergillus piperis CBS 112811]|uniref:Secreted protein n=1 Tax=Aspergillus piperis CBS 112811 TaxID=1448313 RepID=A0A8G1R4D5_9EURO|nr:hypothetical protein BO85DRAFT_292883 [Aspergillus piperis CBS 112811]RAH58049.1 hypothetical protein BO85DRAFT_292883 [Aspergillus piperis CBS 112811]